MKYHNENGRPTLTAADACKREGFRSIREVSRLVDVSESTIWRKFNKKPEEFYALIERARAKL